MPRYSRFSPNWSSPIDLEAITVAREAEISAAVESVRQSVLTKNKHHLLFVGSRGAGKTHLITLVNHRLGQMEDLQENLRVAWLNEDETSDTLLSLLLRCYRALAKDYPDDFPADATEAIYDLTNETDARHAMTNLLLEKLKNRTLLLLAENLDAIFKEFGDGEQKRWRALLQDHPQFCTIATAQRLFEDIADQEAPFFGFFQVTHLKPFTVNQAIELVAKIAESKSDTDLAEFARSSRGAARIRALHHLTGGNQRLFIILSEFINKNTLDELVSPFEELVDEQLTPYYQERLRWLSTQQRKIVEHLCTIARAQTVKNIARHLFATSQSISSQLKDLKETGYVRSKKVGRESYYELAEPLMRLSHQVKEARGHSPLRMLVDFLRIWYDESELLAFKQSSTFISPLSFLYFQQALDLHQKEGNLRLQFLAEDAEGIDPKSCSEADIAILRDLAEESANTKDLIRLGDSLAYKFKHEEATTVYTRVLENLHTSATDLIKTHFKRGLTYHGFGKIIEARADFAFVLKNKNSSPKDLSLTHASLAFSYMVEQKWPQAFTHVRKEIQSIKKSRTKTRFATPFYIDNIFHSGQSKETWDPLLHQLIEIYKKHTLLSHVSSALVRRLKTILNSTLSNEGLIQWHQLWVSYSKEAVELDLPTKLLGIAIKYHSQDKNEAVLLELPSEERQILKQALGLEEK